MESKWLAIRKKYNKGSRIREKTGQGTDRTSLNKVDTDAIAFLTTYTSVGYLINKSKPSVKPPGMIDTAEPVQDLAIIDNPIRPNQIGRKRWNENKKQQNVVCKGLLKEIAIANKQDQQKMRMKLFLDMRKENPGLSVKDVFALVDEILELSEPKQTQSTPPTQSTLSASSSAINEDDAELHFDDCIEQTML